MSVPPATAQALLELVRKSGILSPAALDRALAELGSMPEESRAAAQALVERGVLTRFQAKLLLAGRHRGFRLGAYIIRDQLGQGGMGSVYLAEHETLRRRVAIKVLAPSETTSPVAVERFRREARAAAALDHPNIVRIFDVGQQGGTHYLVMEYVDGQTLDRVVASQGPLPCGRAAEYITQAAAGLQHAYEKGFVHRDIKPANLMLARDGTIKILDMGLARSAEEQDSLTERLDRGAVVGTADYIAPEQAMNHPELDIRADIYSLGATFFTLVTGRPPFDGNTTQKLLQHQMREPPSVTSIDQTFPPGLSAVIVRMMAKKPADRYQTPAEVIAALAPWLPAEAASASRSRTDLARSAAQYDTLSEVTSSSTRPLTHPKLPTPPRRSRRGFLVAGGVGLLVLAVIVGGLAGVFSGKDTPASGVTAPPPEPAPAAGPPAAVERPAPGALPASGVTPGTPAAPAPRLSGLVYDLDLTGRRPYSERGKVLGDPARPTVKWLVSTRSGEGPFPPEWQASTLTAEGEYIGLLEDRGGPALGVRPATPAATATLLTPTLPFPAGKARLRIVYQTEPGAGQVPIRFRPTQPRATNPWELGQLPATGGEWQTKEVEFDLHGATAGRFELVAGNQPEAGLWVKGFTAQDPAPLTERSLYRLDLGQQQPFVQRTVRFQKPGSKVPLDVVSESGPGKLPSGWYRWLEYPDTVAEFFAEGSPGQRVLGIRNISGTPGVMLTTPESAMPTSRCRLRLLYQTGPTSPGFVVRFRPTKPQAAATWDVATLPASGGSWRLAVLDLHLKGATGGLFEISNGAPGIEAAVRLREFVVTEPPSPAAP